MSVDAEKNHPGHHPFDDLIGPAKLDRQRGKANDDTDEQDDCDPDTAEHHDKLKDRCDNLINFLKHNRTSLDQRRQRHGKRRDKCAEKQNHCDTNDIRNNLLREVNQGDIGDT